MVYVEIFYLIEIILQFFTTYKDSEHFENVYTLRLIAKEYVLNGSFVFHVLAAIPWTFIMGVTFEGQKDDPQAFKEWIAHQQLIRNLLLLKMLRLFRSNSQDSVTDEIILKVMQSCYKTADRDERIAYDRQVINVVRILKSVLLTLIITYLLGLFWYRLSDFWQFEWFDNLVTEDGDTWVKNNKLVRKSLADS